MGCFKNFKNNDLVYILILFLLFFIFLPFFWGRWGAVFVDSARELYVPTLILNGKVLYKDILNLYGPFAYQLNALLYFIFGININVLFWAGTINSLVIMYSSYFIVRSFSSSLTSFVSSLMIMCTFIFRCTYECYSNYFFPYSYAIVYSLSFTLLSLCFLLYYLKTENIKLIYLSLFFMGLSLITKLDFCLFLLIFIPFFLGSKKIKLFKKLIGMILLCIPALFSWGVLFLQGVGFKDIENIFVFGQSFFNSPTVRYFNENFIGGCLNRKILLGVFNNCLLYLSFIIPIFMFSLIFVITNLFLKNRIIKLITNVIFISIVYANFDYFTSYFYACMGYGRFDFSWIAYLVILIFSIVIIKNVISYLLYKKEISLKEKSFLIVTLSGILISWRTIWKITIENIGNFVSILLIITIITFLMEILPDYIPKINKKIIKVIFALTFTILSSSYIKNFYYQTKLYSYEFKSSKGNWYMPKGYGEELTEIINYMKSNVDQNSKIIMVPESPVISYFTGLSTYPKYYSLIPHIIEAYGELNILRDLEKDKPDYFIISSKGYLPYGDDYFGRDFALGIGDFVGKYYHIVKIFSKQSDIDKPLTIKIYKLNNIIN